MGEKCIFQFVRYNPTVRINKRIVLRINILLLPVLDNYIVYFGTKQR